MGEGEFPSIDEMVRRIVEASRSRPSKQTPEKLRTLSLARKKLHLLNSLCHQEELFLILKAVFPFTGGTIETVHESNQTEPAIAVFNLPDSFVSTMAQLRADDPALSILTRAPSGIACRDVDAIPAETLTTIPLIQELYPHHGVEHVSAFSIVARPIGWDREFTAIFLFQENGSTEPTWQECRALETLHEDIREALARMKLPLLPHEPIRWQILEEQRTGYALVRHDRTLLEANYQAFLLASNYAKWGSGIHRRTWFTDFVGDILSTAPASGSSARYISHPCNRFLIEAYVHRLAKECYAIPDDAFLIEMRWRPAESQLGGRLRLELLAGMPHRQREIATLLVSTGLSYKQIASELGLSEGTVRKHTERIYRALKVHSRPELVALLK